MITICEQQPVLIDLHDESASEDFARCLAAVVHAPLVMAFSGDIGAGKTTIVRAMLKALGVQTAIKSPTFSLVESYNCTQYTVHHFDLYRIHHEEELEYIGFRDYFSKQSICCIEWAEQAGHLLPHVDIRCTLRVKGAGRELELRAFSAAGQHILAYFAGER